MRCSIIKLVTVEIEAKLLQKGFSFQIPETGIQQRPSFCSNPSLSPTKKLNLLDEFMSLNVEQNLTFMVLNQGLRLISMYLFVFVQFQ